VKLQPDGKRRGHAPAEHREGESAGTRACENAAESTAKAAGGKYHSEAFSERETPLSLTSDGALIGCEFLAKKRIDISDAALSELRHVWMAPRLQGFSGVMLHGGCSHVSGVKLLPPP
jgi:hypothetical protein